MSSQSLLCRRRVLPPASETVWLFGQEMVSWVHELEIDVANLRILDENHEL
jgi:hypothetical protein